MGYGREIVKAELEAEAIARHLKQVAAAQPKPELERKAPRIIQFPSPYQHVVVAAGKTDVPVYYEAVPEGKVGFIQRVGNNYFQDGFLKWYIDGHLVISPYVDFEIASPNNPLLLEPWMRVEDEVLWTATNNSKLSQHWEVYLQGIMVPLEDVPLLLALGLPVSQKG